MINPTRWGMNPASGQTFDDLLICYINLDHIIDRNTCSLHCICLWDGPGKSIEQKSLGTVFFCDALLHQINDDLVRDQSTRVHDPLGCNA